jgi:hypothetical protein
MYTARARTILHGSCVTDARACAVTPLPDMLLTNLPFATLFRYSLVTDAIRL